ncbi:putative membrane protein [Xanthomonas sacchari]|uniref:hypothetical protein n=1 Tax=Xanthomonas sacchari TaxID=56458 RepID=UPI0027892427|nr:hypothetical protein [Xanthomonas sacchari]MDQ1092408.1 putative membrane protein [Xanthomonas sacchari]
MIGAWATTALDEVATYLWQTELACVEAAIATPTPAPASVEATPPPGSPPQAPQPPTPTSAQRQEPVLPAADAKPDIQQLLHALRDQKVLEALVKLLR